MNDYTLYLVKRAYYKKQLIKRAGNPINKRKSKIYKMNTDPAYVTRGLEASARRLGVPEKHMDYIVNRAQRTIDKDKALVADGISVSGYGRSPQSAMVFALANDARNGHIPEWDYDNKITLHEPKEQGLSEGALGIPNSTNLIKATVRQPKFMGNVII